jgi:hypothetical protein
MAGLFPAVHVVAAARKTWMPGTRPGMTIEAEATARKLTPSPWGSPLAGPQTTAPPRSFQPGIFVRLEADQNLAAGKFQYRALDHRGLRQHQRDGLFLRKPFLILIGQFLECRAGAVEQNFPTDFLRPAFQLAALDAFRLVVLKIVAMPFLSRKARAFFIVSQFLMP